MIRVGFFRELAGARPDDPSLHDAPRVEHPDRERLVGYLAGGELHVCTSGVVRDVLRPSSAPVGTASSLTDHTHVWPSVLAYYVRTYGIALPDEFIEHARSSGWSVARSTP